MYLKKKHGLAKLFFFFIVPSLNPAIAGWVKSSADVYSTRVVVESWHADESYASACNNQVIANMHRIDALMSTYKQDSEVSRINERAYQESLNLSAEVFSLLQRSHQFSKLSRGAFDITYASIGFKYDYREQKQPSLDEIDRLLDRVDYRNLILEDQSVKFSKPGMRIDLGGIAKGHAVDQGIQILKDCGIQHAMVTAGGDSHILGDRQGRDWMIGIQHPRKKGQYVLRIPLSNTAISTSGDYERYFITDNERIHHIINPDTGKSAKNSWSASVIGPDATTTDALSTAVFILGAQQGLELINSLPGIDAIIIDDQGVVHYSSGLINPDQAG
ncbi:MAG: FAD:protein FMN transferase [Gammaproteobacteria bacterium]|nr:FAD:protein FMN transferase [Gammaproteobacteria bacterium]